VQRVQIGESFVGDGAEAALKVSDVLPARHAPANRFFTPE